MALTLVLMLATVGVSLTKSQYSVFLSQQCYCNHLLWVDTSKRAVYLGVRENPSFRIINTDIVVIYLLRLNAFLCIYKTVMAH